jgi:hypothetical protein
LPSWIRIRIRIPNPDPDPQTRLNTDPIRIRIRIHNPANNTKKRGWGEKFVDLTVPFYCSHKYHKNVNYFIFEQVKKKI